MEIILDNISKTYGKNQVPAVSDLSFSVRKGSLFGLIGPDGAGKTTLFRILATLLLADKGQATVMGMDVVKDFKKIRQYVGYMPGKFSLYQDLSVEENLTFFATVFGTTIKENYDLIKDIYIQLEPFKDRRAGQLSGGMKQKLALCCALIHKPRILLLDEPTTGVDTVSRKEFWSMLTQLKKSGLTILVSTPYMDEALLCEEIALLQGGKILSINTPAGIIDGFKGAVYSIKSARMIVLLKDLRLLHLAQNVYGYGDVHHLVFPSEISEENKIFLLNTLREKGHSDVEIKRVKPEIEDCFIQLMQQLS